MATNRNFFESSSGLKIEVEGASGGSSNSYLAPYLDAIGSIASVTAAQINRIPEDQRPNEVEITYAIKALRDGGFAVAAGNSGNFKVSLKWSASEENGGGLLGNLPQLPDGIV